MAEAAQSIATSPSPSVPVKPRVVAVDDQSDSLRLLQLRVQAGGMDCATFSDGPSALNYISSHPVDIIILDVMMPGMDGFEVCRRLKANERTKDIPVLFLTAKMDPTDKVRGLEVGGHDYLSKPVEQQELVARARAALRVKRLQDQLKGELQLQEQIHQLHQGLITSHWLNTFGQLAASLAHEINNPLAAALGGIQLLELEEGLPPIAQNRIQLIDQSLQRAGQKLRSLLLIAHSPQTPQDVPLDSLISDLITVVNFRLVISKVAVNANLDTECRWNGLHSELARAILYVINNAIEAVMNTPEPTIWVSLRKLPDYYRISIADSGPGIDESIRRFIFDGFFTTKGPSHSGVGLHLAKRILTAASGSIELSPSPDRGNTEIVILLPHSRS